jgi:hypothetical protein
MSVMLLSTSMPSFASEKDECVLASKNCKTEVDSIQQKIVKLDAEIQKGQKVYTVEELKKLHAKLSDANALLDDLMKH